MSFITYSALLLALTLEHVKAYAVYEPIITNDDELERYSRRLNIALAIVGSVIGLSIIWTVTYFWLRYKRRTWARNVASSCYLKSQGQQLPSNHRLIPRDWRIKGNTFSARLIDLQAFIDIAKHYTPESMRTRALDRNVYILRSMFEKKMIIVVQQIASGAGASLTQPEKVHHRPREGLNTASREAVSSEMDRLSPLGIKSSLDMSLEELEEVSVDADLLRERLVQAGPYRA